jgi:formylglycine-generating enzyme required for sulfatase activity
MAEILGFFHLCFPRVASIKTRRKDGKKRLTMTRSRCAHWIWRQRRLLILVVLTLVFAWQGARTTVAAHGRTKVNRMDGLTYVWIPSGTFRMGCSPDDSECFDSEKPAHTVTLTRGFWIGQTAVTQAAYSKVMDSNPSTYHGAQLPVEEVAWDNAKVYCERIKMRLPTEAEWEYAARGGAAGARYAEVEHIAWYSGNAASATHVVAQKQPNAFGVYDMLGNVREWVADWYGPYAAAEAIDPQGPRIGRFRVGRGGSWYDSAQIARASSRGNNGGGCGPACHGFRCAAN